MAAGVSLREGDRGAEGGVCGEEGVAGRGGGGEGGSEEGEGVD